MDNSHKNQDEHLLGIYLLERKLGARTLILQSK